MTHFLVCIAGLSQEAVEMVRREPAARFTGARDNAPIIRPLNPPSVYRSDTSKYFHEQLAQRIQMLRPEIDVSIILVHINHPESTENFVRSFFPFAIASSLDPVGPDVFTHDARRIELSNLVGRVASTTENLRARISSVRESLSGHKFSPFTLPLRNFRSDVLKLVLGEVFQLLGKADNVHDIIKQGRQRIEQRHPLVRPKGNPPHYEDDRKLRFKSPGRALHGINRGIAEGHPLLCLINSSSRLGSPLRAGFHYDCDYKDRSLDHAYFNCHGDGVEPAQSSHVNIFPSDAVR